MTERRWTVERWERHAEWPLAIAALLFLAAYSCEILATALPAQVRTLLNVIDYGTWVVFAVDFVVRVGLARRRHRYVLRHLLDLAIVLLPLLRPLRLLRLLVLLRFIERRAASTLQGRVAAYVAVSMVLLIYTGALAELAAERGAPGANITDFSTSLWWAMTTITTVGYGDHYPVTAEGRLVAALLMIAGIAFIGMVTASVASWLVHRVSVEPEEDETQRSIAALQDQITALTTELRTQRAIPAADRGSARPPEPGPPPG